MIGDFSATDVESKVIPADQYRSAISIQLYTGGPVHVGFGDDAEVGKGLRLSSSMPFVTIKDARARESVSMICDTGDVAAGGFDLV